MAINRDPELAARIVIEGKKHLAEGNWVAASTDAADALSVDPDSSDAKALREAAHTKGQGWTAALNSLAGAMGAGWHTDLDRLDEEQGWTHRDPPQ